MRLLLLVLAASALISAASAQSGGPPWATYEQIHGDSYWGELGRAVADAGDVDGDGLSDIIVGEPGADPNGIIDAGSAYVYSSATGTLLFRLDGDTVSGDFGQAVAGVGDINGDGYAEFIVGAPRATAAGGPSHTGSVFVYSGSTGALLFRFDGGQSDDFFGWSVSGAGDSNGDGFLDFAIGAIGVDVGAIGDAGAVYIYSGFLGNQLLQISGSQASGRLGTSLDGGLDLSGNGMPDLVIGEKDADIGALVNAGRVWCRSGANGALIHRIDGVQTQAQFGTSVAMAGDIDNDGRADIIVGAPNTTPSGSGLQNAGRAQVYSGATAAELYRFDGLVAGAYHGRAVAGGTDADGDGRPDLLIGSPGQGVSVELRSGANGNLIREFLGNASSGQFGNVVNMSADVNGDGLGDVLIGAPLAERGGVNSAGSALVYVQEPNLPGSLVWQRNSGNDRWYSMLDLVDWAGAAATADGLTDVDLVTVRNIDEHDWLFTSLMNSDGVAYIGLNDVAVEGNFVWRSGELTHWWAANNFFGTGNTPGNWYFQEPNNLNNEDYGTIGRPGVVGGSGEWNDDAGTYLRKAILEWPAQASPQLSYVGSCPGAGIVTCNGLTPGANAAVVYGTVGSMTVQAGGCGAMGLQLVQPTLLLVAAANGSGELQLNVNLPAWACGSIYGQVIDLAACVASNALAF